ncbi:MAG: hypothetical protein HC796_01470 [Synechococcaceae cyanobacterium RL_1_2]|nr:hypothetical protein [Synechococcaceae cyanobacterium RL_1_2]
MLDSLNLNPDAGFNQTAGMFNFSFAPGVSLEQMANFKAAGMAWSAYLDDDITINIHVETSDYLPENVIGAALPHIESKVSYNKVLEALNGDISSDNDKTAFGNLPGDYIWQKGNEKEGKRGSGKIERGAGKFDILVEGGLVEGVDKLNLTTANAKALGLSKSKEEELDGYILISNLNNFEGIAWDYNFLDGKTTGVDFFSVAIHEIGHVMGFVSGVDDNEWLTQVASFQGIDYSTVVYEKFEEQGSLIKAENMNKPEMAMPLDLFRFTQLSASQGVVDLSISEDAYFSIDGGKTKIAGFSSGEDHQASHWEVNSYTGIMDPTLKLNEQRIISNIDLKTMDVIGYDLKTTNNVGLLNRIGNELAQSLGVTIGKLSNILGDGVTQSVLTPTSASFRVEDILDMMKDSKVYDEVLDAIKDAYQWGFGGGNSYHWGFGGGNSYHWGFGGGNSYHQSIAPYIPILAQYFDTLDPHTIADLKQTYGHGDQGSAINSFDSNQGISPVQENYGFVQGDNSGTNLSINDAIAWDDQTNSNISGNNSSQSIDWSELEVNTNSGLETQIIFTETVSIDATPEQNAALAQELIAAL